MLGYESLQGHSQNLTRESNSIEILFLANKFRYQTNNN